MFDLGVQNRFACIRTFILIQTGRDFVFFFFTLWLAGGDNMKLFSFFHNVDATLYL